MTEILSGSLLDDYKLFVKIEIMNYLFVMTEKVSIIIKHWKYETLIVKTEVVSF